MFLIELRFSRRVNTSYFQPFEPFFERGFDDDEFDLAAREYDDAGLTARSHIDAALSSLTTRALLNELNDRLERRGKLSAAEQAREDAIKRCKKILANAAGKTIHPNAVRSDFITSLILLTNANL